MTRNRLKARLGVILLLCLVLSPVASLADDKPRRIKIQRVEISDAVDQPCIAIDVVFTDRNEKAVVVSEAYRDSLVIKENGAEIPKDRLRVYSSATDLKDGKKRVVAAGSRDAMTVLMVVDTSASMGYPANTSDGSAISKIEAAKQAIRDFVERKSPNDRIAIMPFSSTVPAPDEIEFLSDKDEIIERVDELAARGATSLNKAVSIALQVMEEESGRRVVMLLSDGIDSSFNEKYHVPAQFRMRHEDIVPEIEAAGVQINAIGFGDAAAGSGFTGLLDDRLREMVDASQTGEYVFADDAETLLEIYQGFSAIFLSEIQVYFKSTLTLSDLIKNVEFEIASRGIREQKRFSFSDLMGNVRTAKESFARKCRQKPEDGTKPVGVATTNPKAEFRKATIIFLLIATVLGVLLALPFLFGQEALAPDREPIAQGPSAAMRPINQPGQSAVHTGLAPGVAYRPQTPGSGAAPYTQTQISGGISEPGESGQKSPAATNAAAESSYQTPYFEFASSTGQVCHLLIHPDYNETPLGEAFQNVLKDYQSAGQFADLKVKAETFFVNGAPVEPTQTAKRLGLGPGAKIGVLTA